MENVYLKENEKKKKKQQEQRDIQIFFSLISAAKIGFYSRSVIICSSSNCATSLSVHMKYECEPYMSSSSAYTQRYFVPRIYWLNNQVHSIAGVPTFYCVTNHQEKELLFYCFEHLCMKDIMSQEQLFISPVHFGREFLSTKHINLTHNFKSGTTNHKYLHSFERP